MCFCLFEFIFPKPGTETLFTIGSKLQKTLNIVKYLFISFILCSLAAAGDLQYHSLPSS